MDSSLDFGAEDITRSLNELGHGPVSKERLQRLTEAVHHLALHGGHQRSTQHQYNADTGGILHSMQRAAHPLHGSSTITAVPAAATTTIGTATATGAPTSISTATPSSPSDDLRRQRLSVSPRHTAAMQHHRDGVAGADAAYASTAQHQRRRRQPKSPVDSDTADTMPIDSTGSSSTHTAYHTDGVMVKHAMTTHSIPHPLKMGHQRHEADTHLASNTTATIASVQRHKQRPPQQQRQHQQQQQSHQHHHHQQQQQQQLQYQQQPQLQQKHQQQRQPQQQQRQPQQQQRQPQQQPEHRKIPAAFPSSSSSAAHLPAKTLDDLDRQVEKLRAASGERRQQLARVSTRSPVPTNATSSTTTAHPLKENQQVSHGSRRTTSQCQSSRASSQRDIPPPPMKRFVLRHVEGQSHVTDESFASCCDAADDGLGWQDDCRMASEGGGKRTTLPKDADSLLSESPSEVDVPDVARWPRSYSDHVATKRHRPTTSFIRPVLSRQPKQVRSSRKSDPVQRYHELSRGWSCLKLPGDESHKHLRWSVREHMARK